MRSITMVLVLFCVSMMLVSLAGAEAPCRGGMVPRSLSLRLRGGDDSDSEEVMVEEEVEVAVPEMTRKEMENQIAEIMAGEMPSFVRVRGPPLLASPAPTRASC